MQAAHDAELKALQAAHAVAMRPATAHVVPAAPGVTSSTTTTLTAPLPGACIEQSNGCSCTDTV
eukprot:744440-Pleurochrysis_carterae.AAC.1